MYDRWLMMDDGWRIHLGGWVHACKGPNRGLLYWDWWLIYNILFVYVRVAYFLPFTSTYTHNRLSLVYIVGLKAN